MCYRGNGVRSTGRARTCVAILAILAMGAFSACQPAASQPAGSGKPASALPGVPAPADAVVDLGGGSAAIDGNRQFVAYRSTASPATALKRFEAQLKAAGYRSAGRRTGWNTYLRGSGRDKGDIVLVYVEPDGPPTTILVAMGSLDDVTTADGRTAGAATPEVGTPDPTSAIKSHPTGGQGSGGNGNGSGGASGSGGGSGSGGNGGGQGSGGGNGSSGGSGGDKGKPKPSPTPRPTHTPRPTATPRAHDDGTSAPKP